MFGIWAQGFIDGAGQWVLWLGFLKDDDDDDWGRETNILWLCALFDILHDINDKRVCFVGSNNKNIAHTHKIHDHEETSCDVVAAYTVYDDGHRHRHRHQAGER